MVDAVNAGDAAQYASVYGPDAVITIHGSGVLRGRAAIEQHEVALLREFPGARLAFQSIWQQGMSAVVHYAVKAPVAGGLSMGHEGLLFYHFHPAGLIAEEHRYQDSLTPMAQMGMLGSTRTRPPPSLPTAPTVYVAQATTIESANVAAVSSSFADFDARDEAAFLAGFADDAVLDELMEPDPCIGKGAVRTWFHIWTAAIPDARTEITSIMGVGDFVLAQTVVRGTLGNMLGRVRASHGRVEIHRAVIVHVKAGRFTQVTGFMNGKELAEAAGQWSAMTKR